MIERHGLYALISVLFLVGCHNKTPRNNSSANPKSIELQILSLNDFHGHLAPTQLLSNERPRRAFRVGGATALAATLAELRSQNPRGTLLLDGGDFIHGTLLVNPFEGMPVLDLYRLLGVDAAVIGNHEFDFGPVGDDAAGDRRGALKAWCAAAPFPVLTANVVDPAGRWRNLYRSVLLSRRGIRVGLVGLTTPTTPTTTHASNVRGLRFVPLLASLRRELQILQKKQAEVVILLAHLAGGCYGPTERDCKGELFDLLRELKSDEIDVVVAGHSHRCIWRRFRGMYVVQACDHGLAIGQVQLRVRHGRGVDHHNSRVLPPRIVCHDVFDDGSCEGLRRTGPARGKLRSSPLLARHPRESMAARQLLAGWQQKIASTATAVVTQLSQPLPHHFDRHSPAAQMVAEVLRRAAKADVGLMNGGGVRAGLAAGKVVYKQLYSLHPFDNRLVVVRLTGAQVVELVRIGIERAGPMLQVAGLQVAARCDGSRKLTSVVDQNGNPLSPSRQYSVAMNDFMLKGDGFGPVIDRTSRSDRQVTGLLVRDLIAHYLRTNSLLEDVRQRPSVHLSGRCAGASYGGQPRHICR